MDRLEAILHALEHSFKNKKRRHIAGGVLISVSLLFGGLAITVLSLKLEEIDDEQF